ncbi:MULTISPECIES: LysR family transcriptional regulator [unclassified Streptomyces]|uniref:LysR family transcriptional regulator n=1 Tax=unclassified Streptomyces TaxID=2593676 RepID=UPI0033B6B6D5
MGLSLGAARYQLNSNLVMLTIDAIYSEGVGKSRRLADIDLNLLVALEALLSERNVSRAASKLGRSQPTLSAALGRLRRLFDDELLVRQRGSYRLTPFAADIHPAVVSALEEVGKVLGVPAGFDPETSRREFTVMTSDYVLHVLGGPLLTSLMERAPAVKLQLLNAPRVDADRAGELLRETDGLIVPPGILGMTSNAEIFTDRWVGVADRDNAAVDGSLDESALRELRWVRSYREQFEVVVGDPAWSSFWLGDRGMFVVESMTSLPGIIAGTELVAVVPSRLADTTPLPLKTFSLPRPLPQLAEHFWWDAARESDPGHKWLRGLLAECAAALPPET